MNRGFLVALTLVIGVPAFAGNYTSSAFDNSTIQLGGPRSGVNNRKFFNVEGSANGTNSAFADFAVADFSFTGVSGSVTGLSVSLVESDASFTLPGTLAFYLSSNTAASIDNSGDNAANPSTLKYQVGGANNGIDGGLATLYSMGDGSFTSTGTTNTGRVDTYTLALTGSGLTYLNTLLSGNGAQTVRLVVSADESVTGGPATAGTFAGFTNTSLSGPSMTISTAPEPASMAALAFGAIALIRRRRLP